MARIRLQFSSVALCYESALDFVFILCRAYQIPKPQQALTVNKVWAQFSLSFCLEKLFTTFCLRRSWIWFFTILRVFYIHVLNSCTKRDRKSNTLHQNNFNYIAVLLHYIYKWLPAKAISHWNSFSEKMNFKVQKNCANMVKIPSSVSFHEYFQVFYMNINICFANFVL